MSTYYASSDTKVFVPAAEGATEVIDFADGSVKTDNPLWTETLDRYCALGVVSKTAPKKGKE